MIRNIVFDIGKVLLDFRPTTVMYFDEKTAERVDYAIWGSGLWEQTDHGLTDDKILFEKMLSASPEVSEQITEVFMHPDMVARQFDYAETWVRELKEEGYGVYYLSNYSRHLRDTAPQLISFRKYMDGGIFSADVKLVKPDPAVYRLFLCRFGLKPEECLFIDDRAENTEGALRAGMHAIRFTEYSVSRKEIEAYLKNNRN